MVKVQLPKLLLEEVDCFISIPVLKVHVMTGVTLTIKNLWGCYPDSVRGLHHKNLNHKLALITKLLNSKIVVIDGMYALDGHGPMYGEVKKMDMIISSNNAVVADSLGAAVMGIPLKKAEHILIAEKEGLGTTNLGEIRMNENWEKFKTQFYINKTLIDMLSVPLFHSEILAKIVLDSSFTPIIYKVGKFLRNPDEKKLATQIKRCH